jgi:hypothetical protein
LATNMKDVIGRLLDSGDPSIRLKTKAEVLGEDLDGPERERLKGEIASSARVRSLLSERGKDGRIGCHPYTKWFGAHWVLASLADLEYPPGDDSLRPMMEQIYDWLFSEEHLEFSPRHHAYAAPIRMVSRRPRVHASMEGNAIYYSLKLGLGDKRTDLLAKRLIDLQWPDGGWNCDRRPGATNSSFHESLLPLRGLTLHAQRKGNAESRLSATKAAEVFLKRRLLWCYHRPEELISARFQELAYPYYWHFGILQGLKVLAEAGFLADRRCDDAIALLVAKRLPDGGFPCERIFYRRGKSATSGRSLCDWGRAGRTVMNEFVTVDALSILRSRGLPLKA